MNAPIAATLAPSVHVSSPAKPCTLVQRLKGGIGNQLFQIAFALSLARATGARLAFDLDGYRHDGYGRQPVLSRLLPDAALLASASLRAESARLLRESDFSGPAGAPMPGAWTLPPGLVHLVLDGYWQDSRWVADEDVATLRAQLAATVEPTVTAWAARIRASAQPIALHVRRQDYRHHGLCSDAYLLDSLRWLLRRHGDAEVFVFTDEPNATAHLLASQDIRHVAVRSGDDLADLHLMSLCRRHVIANSSFSWWAARLSAHQDVIAPDPWSTLAGAPAPSPELLPPLWRRVPGALAARPEVPVGEALDREQFRIDFQRFFARGVPAGWSVAQQPCLDDATRTTGIDAHYVYHTAWAARRLLANPVAEHVDIGSDHRFTTIASAFQPMRFLDYRPCEVRLPGLSCGPANLLALEIPDASLDSLSCMHVVEHIGLGRYGDPIDAAGADTAMAALERVLAPGGLLYFVVPVGEPCVVFNAHRVFRASDVVRRFGTLELLEFSLVGDDGRFVEHVAVTAADGQRYACGCFLFRKPAVA